MSTTKHTEEKDKKSQPGEPLPGEPPIKEPKNAPQPGPPVAVQGASETEGDLIIIRGEGPLLDASGRRGEGPIIEAVSHEEFAARKERSAREKEERETAIRDVEERKAFKEPRGKEASHEDWKPADLQASSKAEKEHKGEKGETHKVEVHKAEPHKVEVYEAEEKNKK